MEIRDYTFADLPEMTEIWNSVIKKGNAFPAQDEFTGEQAANLFAAQSACRVAVEEDRVKGVYIVHPVNDGRCGHIANASYAVAESARCRGIGRALVEDSIAAARSIGFTGMQYNAVVSVNAAAIKLYEDIGFVRIGRIPGGYRMLDGSFSDTFIYLLKF